MFEERITVLREKLQNIAHYLPTFNFLENHPRVIIALRSMRARKLRCKSCERAYLSVTSGWELAVIPENATAYSAGNEGKKN